MIPFFEAVFLQPFEDGYHFIGRSSGRCPRHCDENAMLIKGDYPRMHAGLLLGPLYGGHTDSNIQKQSLTQIAVKPNSFSKHNRKSIDIGTYANFSQVIVSIANFQCKLSHHDFWLFTHFSSQHSTKSKSLTNWQTQNKDSLHGLHNFKIL